jgi:hypothetical protein
MKFTKNDVDIFPSVELRIIFKDIIRPEVFNGIKEAMEAWAFLCIYHAFGDGVIHNYSDANLDDEDENGSVILMQMDWGSCEEEYLKYLFDAIDEICGMYNETEYYAELKY